MLKIGKVTDFQAHQIEHQLGAYTNCNHGASLAVIHPVLYRHIYKSGTARFTRWAQNGVLLLNAVLTVRAGMAGSHAGMGWETLTDKIIALLGEREKPIVFLLWGGYARRKAALIPKGRHLILEAAHPSPLSAHNGFFGCRHFSKANAFLDEPIDWQL